MIKGIVFDKDGVLVDFDRTWIKMLVDMAVEWADGDTVEKERLLEVAGYDQKTNSFYAGSVWAAGNTDDLVAVWDVTGDVQEQEKLSQFINQRCLDCEIIPLFPVAQLQKLFRTLTNSGLKLGITTNDVEASAIKTMDDFGLSRYLSLVVGYDSVDNPKPAADPVLAFCQECDLKPNEIIVVGDNVHDMEMGLAGEVGLRIAVLSGNSSAEEITPFANHVLKNVLELEGFLTAQGILGTMETD